MSDIITTNGKSTTTAANGGKKRKSGERRGIRLNPAIDNVKALGVDVSGSSNGLGRAGGVDAGVGMDAACQMAQDTAAFDLSKRPAHLMGTDKHPLRYASAQIRNLGAPETLIAAVTYAAHDWHVFPLAEGSKKPLAGSAGLKAATTDRTQHIAWFDDGEYFRAGGNPKHNIGIATGATDAGYDLVVLDVDTKDGKDGGAVLRALEGVHGALPDTLMQTTPSGGLHYLFKVAAGAGIGIGTDVFKAHGRGLDVRGEGGYIVASPSEVDGKPYTWRNDLLLAELPGAWVQALRGECPAGGKRGAVSASNGERAQVVRGELLPMPEDVQAALAEHAVPSSVGRVEWLQVLSVLSAFVDGENAARKWSSSGEYADKFNEAEFSRAWAEVHGGWNDGVPMAPGVLFNLVQAQGTGWKTPEQRRKAAQAAAQPRAQAEASGVPWTLGDVPEYLQPLQPHTDAAVSVQALGGEELEAAAQATLREVTATAEAVWARAQRSAAVGHDAEWLFIAGMLAMNADWVKYQVEHNPIPKGRGSKYHTKMGTVRAVIMHSGGRKPAKAEDVNMDLFMPDYVGGTADAVTRLACRLMLDRDAAQGNTPTADERARVRRVFEISQLGLWWRENATNISKEWTGWSLKSAVDNGLSRATRYTDHTSKAVSGQAIGSGQRDSAGGGLVSSGSAPNSDRVAVLADLREKARAPFDAAASNRTRVDFANPLADGTVPWLDWSRTKNPYPTPTAENVGLLIMHYGARVRLNEMNHACEYEFLGVDAGQHEDALNQVWLLAKKNGLHWRRDEVDTALTAWARQNSFHPAKEWISSKAWDGVSRVQALADSVTVSDGQRDNWLMYFERWALGAINALYATAGGASKHMLVLQGAQSTGKTRWFRTLAGGKPVCKDGVMLNVKDKDSVAETLTWWLVELGELEATYTTRQLAELKAFTTKQTDEYRTPYARKSNTYHRRTAFVGTVNKEEALADYTGNTRFATVTAEHITVDHGVDVQQFWAEILHIWNTGTDDQRRHWLTKAEEAKMEHQNARYTTRGTLHDYLELAYEWDAEGMAQMHASANVLDQTNFHHFATIYNVIADVGGPRISTQAQKNEVGAALRQLGAIVPSNARWKNGARGKGAYLPPRVRMTL